MRARPIEDRFWMFVRKSDGCWEWTGNKTPFGYGLVVLWLGTGAHPKRIRAHRLSYKIHFGEIPDGMCILHHCDNPSCVRPDHLYAGTRTENAADRDRRGRIKKKRGPKGERSHLSKITEDQAKEVLRRYSEGQRPRQIKEEMRLPISVEGTRSIVLRKCWRHLE